LDDEVTRDDVIEFFLRNPNTAITYKTTASEVFSFGRDHGHFGRILNQTVISIPSLAVRSVDGNNHSKDGKGNEIVGYAFTPQDGNSLLSSVTAVTMKLNPEGGRECLTVLDKYRYREI